MILRTIYVSESFTCQAAVTTTKIPHGVVMMRTIKKTLLFPSTRAASSVTTRSGTMLAGGLLIGLALAGILGCKEDAGSALAPQLPQVEVISVTTQTVPDEPEFIGESEASRPVEIRSQVTGILKAVLYKEGRDVKKGVRLYQIDPVPFQAAVASAKAKIAQAEAKVVQAKQYLARVQPLLAEQAVSQKDVDDAVAEDLSSKAALQGAKADLVKAQFDLDNTLITAPIDGLIERSRYYEGRLVSAQTDLLTTIHRVDPMYVVTSVPESFFSNAATTSSRTRSCIPVCMNFGVS